MGAAMTFCDLIGGCQFWQQRQADATHVTRPFLLDWVWRAGPVLGWGDRCGCTGPHSERAPYLRKRGYYNCYKQVVQGPPVAHVKGDPPPYNNFAQGPKYARAGPAGERD